MKIKAALLAAILATPALAQVEMTLGAEFDYGGFPRKVVSVGAEVYEYVSDGRMVDVRMVGNIDAPLGMIFPEEGDTVRVDPSAPMIWIADQPHHIFAEGAPWIATYDASQGLLLLADNR